MVAKCVSSFYLCLFLKGGLWLLALQILWMRWNSGSETKIEGFATFTFAERQELARSKKRVGVSALIVRVTMKESEPRCQEFLIIFHGD